VCRIKCGCDESGVNGRGDQLLEGACGGQIECSKEVLVCEASMGA
jgi:hypothetical protein